MINFSKSFCIKVSQAAGNLDVSTVDEGLDSDEACAEHDLLAAQAKEANAESIKRSRSQPEEVAQEKPTKRSRWKSSSNSDGAIQDDDREHELTPSTANHAPPHPKSGNDHVTRPAVAEYMPVGSTEDTVDDDLTEESYVKVTAGVGSDNDLSGEVEDLAPKHVMFPSSGAEQFLEPLSGDDESRSEQGTHEATMAEAEKGVDIEGHDEQAMKQPESTMNSAAKAAMQQPRMPGVADKSDGVSAYIHQLTREVLSHPDLKTGGEPDVVQEESFDNPLTREDHLREILSAHSGPIDVTAGLGQKPDSVDVESSGDDDAFWHNQRKDIKTQAKDRADQMAQVFEEDRQKWQVESKMGEVLSEVGSHPDLKKAGLPDEIHPEASNKFFEQMFEQVLHEIRAEAEARSGPVDVTAIEAKRAEEFWRTSKLDLHEIRMAYKGQLDVSALEEKQAEKFCKLQPTLRLKEVLKSNQLRIAFAKLLSNVSDQKSQEETNAIVQEVVEEMVSAAIVDAHSRAGLGIPEDSKSDVFSETIVAYILIGEVLETPSDDGSLKTIGTDIWYNEHIVAQDSATNQHSDEGSVNSFHSTKQDSVEDFHECSTELLPSQEGEPSSILATSNPTIQEAPKNAVTKMTGLSVQEQIALAMQGKTVKEAGAPVSAPDCGNDLEPTQGYSDSAVVAKSSGGGWGLGLPSMSGCVKKIGCVVGSSYPSRDSRQSRFFQSGKAPAWLGFDTQKDGYSCGRFAMNHILQVILGPIYGILENQQHWYDEYEFIAHCREEGFGPALDDYRNGGITDGGRDRSGQLRMPAIEKGIFEASLGQLSLQRYQKDDGASIYRGKRPFLKLPRDFHRDVFDRPDEYFERRVSRQSKAGVAWNELDFNMKWGDGNGVFLEDEPDSNKYAAAPVWKDWEYDVQIESLEVLHDVDTEFGNPDESGQPDIMVTKEGMQWHQNDFQQFKYTDGAVGVEVSRQAQAGWEPWELDQEIDRLVVVRPFEGRRNYNVETGVTVPVADAPPNANAHGVDILKNFWSRIASGHVAIVYRYQVKKDTSIPVNKVLGDEVEGLTGAPPASRVSSVAVESFDSNDVSSDQSQHSLHDLDAFHDCETHPTDPATLIATAKPTNAAPKKTGLSVQEQIALAMQGKTMKSSSETATPTPTPPAPQFVPPPLFERPHPQGPPQMNMPAPPAPPQFHQNPLPLDGDQFGDAAPQFRQNQFPVDESDRAVPPQYRQNPFPVHGDIGDLFDDAVGPPQPRQDARPLDESDGPLGQHFRQIVDDEMLPPQQHRGTRRVAISAHDGSGSRVTPPISPRDRGLPSMSPHQNGRGGGCCGGCCVGGQAMSPEERFHRAAFGRDPFQPSRDPLDRPQQAATPRDVAGQNPPGMNMGLGLLGTGHLQAGGLAMPFGGIEQMQQPLTPDQLQLQLLKAENERMRKENRIREERDRQAQELECQKQAAQRIATEKKAREDEQKRQIMEARRAKLAEEQRLRNEKAEIGKQQVLRMFAQKREAERAEQERQKQVALDASVAIMEQKKQEKLEVEEKFGGQNFRVLSEMRIFAKIKMVISDLVGYVYFLMKFDAKSDFSVRGEGN